MSYHSPAHVGLSKRSMFAAKDILSNVDYLKPSKDLSLVKESCNGLTALHNGYSGRHSDSANVPENYVGFSNLPNQIYRRAVRRGFEFNLMVVGESGLGKSTFINSLFLSEVYNSDYPGPSYRVKSTPSIQTQTFLLKEQGVFLKLRLVDTPGFGDAVDNTDCWQPIIDYIDAQFDEYIRGESRVSRSSNSLTDQRIHALIYFIAPTGHSLKQLDIEFLTRIQDKVNVIPVIAKADTLTVDELHGFKRTILNELNAHKIRVFEFPDPPDCNDRGNEEEPLKIKRLRDRIPFAVVGANTLVVGESGAHIRARSYPWGVVEVENMDHNDFAALRYLLLTAFLQDLRDVTHYVHYENYRSTKLCNIAMESRFQTRDGKDPMTSMEAERKEHNAKMRKMETEMEAVFEQKIEIPSRRSEQVLRLHI
ncbi:unnamed protein product [Dicrocoelium dendriticum]|nr:unnamed protein product [Dicrocoelium dendriticum]